MGSVGIQGNRVRFEAGRPIAYRKNLPQGGGKCKGLEEVGRISNRGRMIDRPAGKRHPDPAARVASSPAGTGAGVSVFEKVAVVAVVAVGAKTGENKAISRQIRWR
jgi:hypothetical protein